MKRLKVFISYRRSNGGIAYAYIIYQRLSKLGIDCFFDKEGLSRFNNDFDKKIEQELESSDYVIVILQPGCMKSKGKDDYYLKEVSIASQDIDKLVFVAINGFQWEKEKVPRNLRHLAKQNIVTTIEIDKLNNSINDIIGSFTLDERYKHYMLMNTLVNKSDFYSNSRTYHQLGDMLNIEPSVRWYNAKRISLMAMGCSSVMSGPLASYVHEKFMQGVSFRLIAVNPESPYVEDIQNNRLNEYVVDDKRIQKFSDGVKSSLEKLVQNKADGKIEYRLTNEFLSYTIQLVECENEEENYVFVEYVPIKAIGVYHNLNPAVTIPKGDKLYDYYVQQFELIWNESEVEFKNG